LTDGRYSAYRKKPISNLLLFVYVYFLYIELSSSNKMTRWITYKNKKQLQLTSAKCMLQLSKQCAFSYFFIQFTEFLISLLVWRQILIKF